MCHYHTCWLHVHRRKHRCLSEVETVHGDHSPSSPTQLGCSSLSCNCATITILNQIIARLSLCHLLRMSATETHLGAPPKSTHMICEPGSFPAWSLLPGPSSTRALQPIEAVTIIPCLASLLSQPVICECMSNIQVVIDLPCTCNICAEVWTSDSRESGVHDSPSSEPLRTHASEGTSAQSILTASTLCPA